MGLAYAWFFFVSLGSGPTLAIVAVTVCCFIRAWKMWKLQKGEGPAGPNVRGRGETGAATNPGGTSFRAV